MGWLRSSIVSRPACSRCCAIQSWGRLYGKSIRGGLLLYGPPGCGKTFIARALAGEMKAKFISVSLADVLDMFVGQTERNVHELFETARRNAPCVIFLDEIDALGAETQPTSQQCHPRVG